LRSGLDNLKVLGDSQLVIYQSQGKWKLKAKNLVGHCNAVGILEQAKEMIKEFSSIELEYIPRADNAKADKLANQSISKRPVMSERVRLHVEAKREAKKSQTPNPDSEPDANSADKN
jgi:ribonuclease H / adenosylcobalamin/alpha-ribazole phosphatase